MLVLIVSPFPLLHVDPRPQHHSHSCCVKPSLEVRNLRLWDVAASMVAMIATYLTHEVTLRDTRVTDPSPV